MNTRVCLDIETVLIRMLSYSVPSINRRTAVLLTLSSSSFFDQFFTLCFSLFTYTQLQTDGEGSTPTIVRQLLTLVNYDTAPELPKSTNRYSSEPLLFLSLLRSIVSFSCLASTQTFLFFFQRPSAIVLSISSTDKFISQLYSKKIVSTWAINRPRFGRTEIQYHHKVYII